MSAADVEGAVLNQVQKLLSAPDLVARTWSTAKRAGEDDITEREVTVLLADFATVWAELFPAEQARIVQLLVERGRRAGGRLTLLAPLQDVINDEGDIVVPVDPRGLWLTGLFGDPDTTDNLDGSWDHAARAEPPHRRH